MLLTESVSSESLLDSSMSQDLVAVVTSKEFGNFFTHLMTHMADRMADRVISRLTSTVVLPSEANKLLSADVSHTPAPVMLVTQTEADSFVQSIQDHLTEAIQQSPTTSVQSEASLELEVEPKIDSTPVPSDGTLRSKRSEAQRARWDKYRKEKGILQSKPTLNVTPEVTLQPNPEVQVEVRKKRTFSAEALENMRRAAKARWEGKTGGVTAEVKAKISLALKKKWAARKGITLPDASPAPETSPEGDRYGSPDGLTKPQGTTPSTQEGYTGDVFYTSEDGHFIGEDGFIVPKDFDEFLARFPNYFENWVRRRLGGNGTEEDIEDWVQDLCLHMKYLPPTSKHRKEGKTDVFQTFNPFAQYGASERRWRYFINMVLGNKFNTIHMKKTKNPVCRYGTMSVVTESDPDAHGEVTDEYIHSKSTYLTDASNREESNRQKVLFTKKFFQYVASTEPEMSPVLTALYEAGSSGDTIREFCNTCQKLASTVELKSGSHKGHKIGMNPKDFNRAKNRLKQLAEHFVDSSHPLRAARKRKVEVVTEEPNSDSSEFATEFALAV